MKGKKKGKDFKLFVQVVTKKDKTRSKYFWAYTQKNSTIASGATPIGIAGRAPDEDEINNFASKEGNYGTHIGANYQLHCQRINIRHWYSLIHSHREGFTTSRRKQPKDFGHWNSQTRLTTKLWFSSRVVTIKSLNSMVVKKSWR
jgi:hypothetical protein